MKVKTKLCPICNTEFTPFNSLQKCCKSSCNTKYLKEKEKAKKTKIREKKKVSVSTLSKVADTLWSKYIRLKAWKCEFCWSKDNLNAHHIFTRHSKSLRWEELNGVCLCAKHHTFSDEFSAHKTSVEFTYWLEEYKGKDYLNKLRSWNNDILKVTPEFLQDKIEYFKTQIYNLENN